MVVWSPYNPKYPLKKIHHSPIIHLKKTNIFPTFVTIFWWLKTQPFPVTPPGWTASSQIFQTADRGLRLGRPRRHWNFFTQRVQQPGSRSKVTSPFSQWFWFQGKNVDFFPTKQNQWGKSERKVVFVELIKLGLGFWGCFGVCRKRCLLFF